MRALRVLLLIMLGLTTGCAAQSAAGPGHVWLFPGIEGSSFWLGPAARGLRDGGVTGAFHYYDWQRPMPGAGGLANLTEHAENRAKAATLAKEIARTVKREPVDLVGYSGGGGMAIFVAEALPKDVHLRRVVLVQPALSPGYDLTPALRRVTGEVINVHCHSDRFTLGLGTELFGTMDRAYVSSAGKDGFDVEKAVSDPALRSRLRQVAWEPAHVLYGHIGGHIGMLGYYWNRAVVAPLLSASEPVSK